MVVLKIIAENLDELIQESVKKALAGSIDVRPVPEVGKSHTLHSIRELADFLGCSTVTAQKYKNERWIPFRQIGRKVMFDTSAVLQAIEQRGKGVKR